MMVINETEQIKKAESFSFSNSESFTGETNHLPNGKNILTKLEKRINKHRNSFLNNNDNSSLNPLITPLLSTNATILSACPSLPSRVQDLPVSKEEEMKKTICLMSDSPFFIHKVQFLFMYNKTFDVFLFI